MMQKTITLYKANGRIIVNDDDKAAFLNSGYKKDPPKPKSSKPAKMKDSPSIDAPAKETPKAKAGKAAKKEA